MLLEILPYGGRVDHPHGFALPYPSLTLALLFWEPVSVSLCFHKTNLQTDQRLCCTQGNCLRLCIIYSSWDMGLLITDKLDEVFFGPLRPLFSLGGKLSVYATLS
jgi:hypothetical protein